MSPGRKGSVRGPEREGRRGGRRSVAERTTLAISIAIVLGLVALVGYAYLVGGTQPAVIEVTTQWGELRVGDDSYYLPVRVTNRGDHAAEDVRVEVALTSAEGRRESAQLRIQFLAGGAAANGVVVFRDDPARGDLSVDVISYLEP